MKKTIVRCLLTVSVGYSALAFVNNASAVGADFRMLGLAMHQETGRNIYLGAIHLDKDTAAPDNLTMISSAKVMEYRVVARRTSIRSLLGNMLLQSEVANQGPPSAATIEFADQLLSAVQGSLYSGDSLEIAHEESKQITASLNGVELVRREDDGIFDYLFLGWVGESGPSTSFRSSIMGTSIDDSMMSAYSAHIPSDERLAMITGWIEPTEATDAGLEPSRAAPAAAVAVAVIPAATKTAPSAAIPDKSATASPAAVAAAAEPTPKPVDEASKETIEPVAEQVAVLTTEPAQQPTQKSIVEEVVDSADIRALDVTEYSHRLAGFNTAVMKLVYSKIQYPRRAVRRSLQGALELDITLQADGSLVEVAVATSSGHTILDGAAVSAAEKALKGTSLGSIDPVAIAEYGSGDHVVIPVPVNFILQ
ncbi:MAG: TonB family protein [Halioglobus sp.]